MGFVSLIDGHIDEPRETTRTDFHINASSSSISFMCPFCMSHVEVMKNEIGALNYWIEEWDAVCPECGHHVLLGDYEYG